MRNTGPNLDDGLEVLLDHCQSNVPFYRAITPTKGGSNERGIIRLKSLPTVSKGYIRDHYIDFVSNGLVGAHQLEDIIQSHRAPGADVSVELDNGRRIVVESTTGSTGCPFVMLKTPQERLALGANLWHLRRQITPDLLASDMCLSTHQRASKGPVTRLHFLDDGFTAEFLQHMVEGGYRWWHTTPRIMRRFAEVAENIQLARRWRIEVIESGSQYLTEEDRHRFSAVYGAKVVNNYGAHEVWTIAYECTLQRLHVNLPHVFVEVLDGDQECRPGAFGEIVVTCSELRLMPFVRYRTGDHGKLLPDCCPCGRVTPTIQLLPDRFDQTIAGHPGLIGKEVFSSVLNNLPTGAYTSAEVREVGVREYEMTVYDLRWNRENFEARVRANLFDLLRAKAQMTFIYKRDDPVSLRKNYLYRSMKNLPPAAILT